MGIQGVKMNKTDILNAIQQKGAIITDIARHLDCERDTIYRWIKIDEDIANAFAEARKEAAIKRDCQDEEIKETAYNSILDLLKNRDVTATLFALKCKCKWDQNVESAANYTINDKGTMDAPKQ